MLIIETPFSERKSFYRVFDRACADRSAFDVFVSYVDRWQEDKGLLPDRWVIDVCRVSDGDLIGSLEGRFSSDLIVPGRDVYRDFQLIVAHIGSELGCVFEAVRDGFVCSGGVDGSTCVGAVIVGDGE